LFWCIYKRIGDRWNPADPPPAKPTIPPSAIGFGKYIFAKSKNP
jgi:hypothetical protein